MASLALGSALTLLGASTAQVPASMLGAWAHGACTVPANKLVITASTAALGTRKPAPIYYDDDGGGDHAAIHWDQEYVVDNFVYLKEQNAIAHNTHGFGMAGAALYKKCKLAH